MKPNALHCKLQGVHLIFLGKGMATYLFPYCLKGLKTWLAFFGCSARGINGALCVKYSQMLEGVKNLDSFSGLKCPGGIITVI